MNVSLRALVSAVVVGLVAAVILVIATLFIVRQHGSAMATAAALERTARDELRREGMTLAGTVALASERALVVMDYLFITEIVLSARDHDPRIAYAILMDQERRALVHTDRNLAGTVLIDEPAVFAVRQNEATSQEIIVAGEPVLEIVAPIAVSDRRWGTLRLALSLRQVTDRIAAIRTQAKIDMRHGIEVVVATAFLMFIIAAMVGLALAKRVASPLNPLMQGVAQLRAGSFDYQVAEQGVAEFRTLGRAFNEMTGAVRARDAALRDAMAETSHALERAEESSRLKSEFLANVSHELRTPLNAIINIPKALARDYEEVDALACKSCEARFAYEPTWNGQERCPCGGEVVMAKAVQFVGEHDEHFRYMNRVIQSGNYLLDVVNNLLDFSKLDAGKMTLNVGECAVAEIVDEVIATTDILASQKGITLERRDIDESLAIRADRLKVSQVLVNLVGNAIKFTPNGGRVDVAAAPVTEDGKGFLRITVRDTGIGIPADKLDIIFESFQQVDGSHTRAHNGTGLGLAITRKLVQLHGGRVWVQSREGIGSTFTVLLPAQAEGMS